MNVSVLRTFDERVVRVRLADGSEFTGRLRTDLLTERSISVHLVRDERDGAGEGVTLYIEDIARITPAGSAA